MNSPPLGIEFTPVTLPLRAGEWMPMLLKLQRSESGPAILRLDNFTCQKDSPITLDTALFPTDLELRPSEGFQALIRVRVSEPCDVPLSIFVLEYHAEGAAFSELVDVPGDRLHFAPSPASEIQVTSEPICTYEDGTKVVLHLAHNGRTTFKNLHVQVSPGELLTCGKTLCRGSFRPGDREQLEVLVRPGPLELVLSAAALGERTTERLPLHVQPVPEKASRPTFRFLEPRGLSRDVVAIVQDIDGKVQAVKPRRGTYPLVGKQKYYVVINPSAPDVENVVFRGIEDRIIVLKGHHNAGRTAWTFLIEVASNELLSKSGRLYYDVETAAGKKTGEIPITLRPPSGRGLHFAATLGAVLTIQGLLALWAAVTEASDWETLASTFFTSWSGWQTLGCLLFIPAVVLALPWFDALQYRLVSEE